MKYLVLLFFVSVVYSHPHPPPNDSYPAIYYDDTELAPFAIFNMLEVGTADNEGLECRTDLDTCCSMDQGFHTGMWFYPDDLQVEAECEGKPMYQTKLDSKITLFRRGQHMLEGYYCCGIETIRDHRYELGYPFNYYSLNNFACVILLNFSRGGCS